MSREFPRVCMMLGNSRTVQLSGRDFGTRVSCHDQKRWYGVSPLHRALSSTVRRVQTVMGQAPRGGHHRCRRF